MESLDQELNDILNNLSPLEADWMDETAEKAITKLQNIPIKPDYTLEDIQSLLDDHFTEGLLCCRLFRRRCRLAAGGVDRGGRTVNRHDGCRPEAVRALRDARLSESEE